MTQYNTHTTEPTLFDHLDFIDKIEALISESESTEVEFKSAKGGFPGSFWETYSAFANTQGGVIILGVKEKNNKFSIDGLTKEQADKYLKEFWNNVNNPAHVSANILMNSAVQVGEYQGSYLIIFDIPMAMREQKPVYLSRNPESNTYKRNHEGDYRCTREEVRRMFADADVNTSRDSEILIGFTIENDIHRESLKQYRNLWRARDDAHPWLALDDKEFLTKLGGYRVNRAMKQEGLTLAGMLMFGVNTSITDPDCCPHFFPDYREYLLELPDGRWSDRVFFDGHYELNLFQFYIKVYNKMAATLPKPFKLVGGVRIDETPAHIALREALINAMIHCDYRVNTNLTIEHRRDKYILSNPGTLLVTVPQYYRGGTSICRNAALQQMFMYIGGSEKAGSGVAKILHGWENANYLEPRIEDRVKPDKVDLILPLVGLLSDDVKWQLSELFGESISNIGHDKLLILAICTIEGEVSNQRLQIAISKHRADITQLLRELSNDNYLIPEGVGRGTKYTLNRYFEGVNVVSGGVNGGVNRRNGGVKTAELILKAITEQGGLNSIALGKIVGKSPRTVEKYLKNFTVDDIIEYRGAAKNGGYYLK
ncbi:MAG: putative DNA binding domain-containing protein [Rikenellaceae bacterium]